LGDSGGTPTTARRVTNDPRSFGRPNSGGAGYPGDSRRDRRYNLPPQQPLDPPYDEPDDQVYDDDPPPPDPRYSPRRPLLQQPGYAEPPRYQPPRYDDRAPYEPGYDDDPPPPDEPGYPSSGPQAYGDRGFGTPPRREPPHGNRSPYGEPAPPPGRGYDDRSPYGDPTPPPPPPTRGYDDRVYEPQGYDRGYDDPEGYDTGYDQRYDLGYDDDPPPPPPSRGKPQRRPRVKPALGDLGPKLPHLPGLSGLRAIALLAVLVFAHDVDLLQGGYLGISTVFTLSGFLMATLALAEWSQTTELIWVRFWDRRGRNIVPPYLAVLITVVVLQAVVRVGSVPTFKGDMFASLGFVNNWRQAFPAEGFASSFTELSALKHLWPISITVQAYLLFPLVFVLLMLVTGRQWRASGYIFGALAALSFGAAWLLSDNAEARRIAYFGTHTRVGEMLVGVVLAFVVLTPRFRKVMSTPQVLSVVRNGAAGALLVLVALWYLVPLDSPSLFHGVTVLNAVLTAWVILAVTMPGPAASILGFAPLRYLGEISLAAYLFHWPLYLLLDEERTGLSGPLLLGARLVATVAVGALVYWAVQRPFKHLKVPAVSLGTGFATVGAVVAAAVFVLPVNPPANISLDIDDGEGPGDLEALRPAAGDADLRVLLVGDEAAGSLVSGFAAWNDADGHEDQQVQIDTHVTPQCPLGGSGPRRRLGEKVDPSIECESWRPRLPEMLEAGSYDVILVAMGGGDLGERKLGRNWQHLGDPGFDVWMAEQIDGLADVLAKEGAPVLWATYPHLRLTGPEGGSGDWTDFDDNDPLRVDRLNELITSTLNGRNGFEIVDIAAWLYEVPRGEFNSDLRKGATFSEQGATLLVERLAPELFEAEGSD
jgi:peptidoglycan/LPS O-acetylase OafA/YrhL